MYCSEGEEKEGKIIFLMSFCFSVWIQCLVTLFFVVANHVSLFMKLYMLDLA